MLRSRLYHGLVDGPARSTLQTGSARGPAADPGTSSAPPGSPHVRARYRQDRAWSSTRCRRERKAELRVLRGHSCPVSGQLFVGRGVDEAADSLDRVRDLLGRGSLARALEEEVLDEMRHAGEPVVLETRTSSEHGDGAR